MRYFSNKQIEDSIRESGEAETTANELMSDPVQLAQIDRDHEIYEQIDALILRWDQDGRPELTGHDEVTNALADSVIAGIDPFTPRDEVPGYYTLAAAIGEYHSSRYSSLTTPQEHTDLFNVLYEIAVEEAVQSVIADREDALIFCAESRREMEWVA